MKVGFTGTREETTTEQFHALCEWMKRQSGVAEFHHGCCVGADSDAWEAAVEHLKGAKVVAHPPTNKSLVSESAIEFADEVRDAKPYLCRNADIVNEADMILACPKGPEEQRSGTWSTIRYGRKLGRRIVIVYPDGSIVEEPAK